MAELSPLSIVHAVVPPRARRWMRRVYDAWHFDSAMRRFAADPEAAVAPDSRVLAELIAAWGNPGWSAQEEYLRVCITQALKSNGPTLECGSGLSTLLLGVVANAMGFEHWALEHEREWSAGSMKRGSRTSCRRCAVSTVPLKHTTDSIGTTRRWRSCPGSSRWSFATGRLPARWEGVMGWCP